MKTLINYVQPYYKLAQYGISGKSLAWIAAFRQNRTQFTLVNGTRSTTTLVTSGVPQGSVLGPTLFLLFINDISSVTSSQLRLFADDTVLYKAINCNDDQHVLQEDLSNLSKWASDWQMAFNVTKCHLLRITNTRNPSDRLHIFHEF